MPGNAKIARLAAQIGAGQPEIVRVQPPSMAKKQGHANPYYRGLLPQKAAYYRAAGVKVTRFCGT